MCKTSHNIPFVFQHEKAFFGRASVCVKHLKKDRTKNNSQSFDKPVFLRIEVQKLLEASGVEQTQKKKWFYSRLSRIDQFRSVFLDICPKFIFNSVDPYLNPHKRAAQEHYHRVQPNHILMERLRTNTDKQEGMAFLHTHVFTLCKNCTQVSGSRPFKERAHKTRNPSFSQSLLCSFFFIFLVHL